MAFDFDIPRFSSKNAANYRSSFSNVDPLSPSEGVSSSTGIETLGQVGAEKHAAKTRMAGTALGAAGDRMIAKIQSEAAQKAERERARASRTSGIIGAIGSIAGAAIRLCDMRLKQDVAELQASEVSDELADLAFAVKALRECS